MRIVFTAICVFYLACSFAQSDSGKYSNAKNDQRIGRQVPNIVLYDTAGKKVKLSSFKGKVLYLDFWATTCAPCIKLFPFEEQLQTRLKKLRLDTCVLIIKICSDSPVEQWKSVIKENNSSAINLILPGKDYKIWRKFKLPYWPTYHLVSKDFKYLGTEISKPNDIDIDYFLFRAINNINFVQSIEELKTYKQEFNKGNTDIPSWYVEWWNKISPLLTTGNKN